MSKSKLSILSDINVTNVSKNICVYMYSNKYFEGIEELQKLCNNEVSLETSKVHNNSIEK